MHSCCQSFKHKGKWSALAFDGVTRGVHAAADADMVDRSSIGTGTWHLFAAIKGVSMSVQAALKRDVSELETWHRGNSVRNGAAPFPFLTLLHCSTACGFHHPVQRVRACFCVLAGTCTCLLHAAACLCSCSPAERRCQCTSALLAVRQAAVAFSGSLLRHSHSQPLLCAPWPERTAAVFCRPDVTPVHGRPGAAWSGAEDIWRMLELRTQLAKVDGGSFPQQARQAVSDCLMRLTCHRLPFHPCGCFLLAPRACPQLQSCPWLLGSCRTCATACTMLYVADVIWVLLVSHVACMCIRSPC